MYNAKPQKLPSGSWRVQINYKGHRKSVTASTKADVIRLSQEIYKEMVADDYKGVLVKKSKQPIKDLMESYVDTFNGSPSSKRGYITIIRTRFLEYQDQNVHAMDKADWQRMINDELKLVSPKTVRCAWGLVAASLRRADIPVPNVKLPRLPDPETEYIPYDRLKDFLNAIKDTPDEVAILLGLHGLRRSEILGLRWGDIDLKEKKISIHGAMIKGDEGWVREDLNKTDKSTRSIPIIIDRLYDVLKEESSGKDPDSLIYTRYADSIYKAVARACNSIGIKPCGVHGLRRTYASICVHQGVPEAYTMETGGWTDRNTMHKHYVKYSQGERNEFTDRIAEAFN